MAPKDKSLIEKLSSYLVNPFKRGPPPKTPIGGIGDRVKNIAKNNFRGIIGVIVPLCVLAPQMEREDRVVKLRIMWMWIFWFYLLHPVAVPNTSLIPVFYLPMLGVKNSVSTCKCYMNETVMLFVLSSWLIVTLNNSGVDKRIAHWFLSSGNDSQFSGQKLVFKVATASFFLGMFSSRLIVTLNLTELITNACKKLDTSEKSDVTAVRHVINNAIQTSAVIGGFAIVHSSYVTLLFRGCYHEFAPYRMELPDIFNYLTYSVFAFPVAFVCFIVNLLYHTVLVGKVSSTGLSEGQRKEIQATIMRSKAEIPKNFSLHELFSIVAAVGFLVAVFFRWAPFAGIGWAGFSEKTPTLVGCKDATVGAIFAIALHILPKSFNFLKIFTAKKKSHLSLKPESAILWWRFVDKNVNYGYIFTFGCAFALIVASREVGLDHKVSEVMASFLEQDFKIGLLVCVLVGAILCNVMTSMAACSVWLPFVLCMSTDGPFPWPSKVYLAALGVGIASNFGFCIPFQYTPGYYTNRSGKVPVITMIKYNIIPVLYCTIILYVFLAFVAEAIWDSSGAGFIAITPYDKTTTTTTPAPTEGGGAGGED